NGCKCNCAAIRRYVEGLQERQVGHLLCGTPVNRYSHDLLCAPVDVINPLPIRGANWVRVPLPIRKLLKISPIGVRAPNRPSGLPGSRTAIEQGVAAVGAFPGIAA